MRGWPLNRAVVVFLILLATSIPVWKLTHGDSAAAAQARPAPVSKESVHIALAFAHPPGGFQLIALGKTIWIGDGENKDLEKDFGMAFPKEGIDLEIKANWPPGTPLTAVRVSVTPDAGLPMERTAWGEGSLDEVLTFQ